MGLKFEAFFYFNKQGRRIEEGILPPLRRCGPVQPTRKGKMIFFSAVKLKELFKKERDYPWRKPKSCPRCNSFRLWGHGFAQAIFDGFIRPLLLKLYRCPDCGCVIRLRPKGYFKRFKLRLRRSDPASLAKQPQIDGYPALSAPGSVTGSDFCANGSKFI